MRALIQKTTVPAAKAPTAYLHVRLAAVCFYLGLFGCSYRPPEAPRWFEREREIESACQIVSEGPQPESTKPLAGLLRTEAEFQLKIIEKIYKLPKNWCQADRLFETFQAVQSADIRKTAVRETRLAALEVFQGKEIDPAQIQERLKNGSQELITDVLSTARAVGECGIELKKAGAKLRQDETGAKLHHAFEQGRLTALELVENPLLALRRIDLSGPIIRGVVVLGDELNSATERLAQSAGPFQGIARLLVDNLAAQVMASLFDRTLDSFEKHSLASPASVARRSCKVYRQPTPRPLITSTMLRRAVLRFAGPPQPHPCDDVDELRKNTCNKVLKKATGKKDVEDARAALAPQHAIEQRIETWTATASAEEFDAPAEAVAVRYEEAAAACPADKECSLQMLNDFVAYIGIYQQDANINLHQYFPTIAAPYNDHATLEDALSTVNDQLRELGGTTRLLADAVKEQSRQYSQLVTHYAKDKTKDCFNRVRLQREQLIKHVYDFAEFSCGADGDARIEQANRSRTDEPISIRTPACDLSPLRLQVRSQTMFESCAITPRASAQQTLEQVAQVISGEAFGVRQVKISGYTDSQPVSANGECARLHNITDNVALSEKRAQAIESSLQQRVAKRASPNAPLKFTSVGRASLDPLCSEQTEECFAKNRRVELELEGEFSIAQCLLQP